MTRETEGETERDRRRYRRGLFDQVARLYEAPVRRTFTQRLIRPAEDVIGVENSRGTALSWTDDVRRGFTAELRQRLGGQAEVGLTLAAAVTMARVRKPASGG